MGEPRRDLSLNYDDSQLFVANNLWRTLVDGWSHSVQTPNLQGRWDLEQRHYTLPELHFACRVYAPTLRVVVVITPRDGGIDLMLPLKAGKLGAHPISAELAAQIEKLARSRAPLTF